MNWLKTGEDEMWSMCGESAHCDSEVEVSCVRRESTEGTDV